MNIQVVTQPSQSPDPICNDLAFFASLHIDTELIAKKTGTIDFPAERMESIGCTVYTLYKRMVSLMRITTTCTLLEAAKLMLLPKGRVT